MKNGRRFQPIRDCSRTLKELAMKKFYQLFLVLLVLTSQLFGQTVEIKKMTEILDTVTEDSIVIFDLDNTIMEASQTLGSDQWFDHRIGQLKNQGLAVEAAVEQSVSEWVEINRKGKVNLVEKSTPGIVRSLQDSGIPTMGLTARPTVFVDRSLEQLRELGVPLYRHTVTDETIDIAGPKENAHFEEGLMSVGGNNKGTILVQFLNKLELNPGRVLFVDDKVKNTKNVEEAMQATAFPYFGFRYGAADAKVKAFDAKLADFEFGYFSDYGVVLSDATAKKLMNQSN